MSDPSPALPASAASGEVRLGRADLHIHTLASDGVSAWTTILRHVQEEPAWTSSPSPITSASTPRWRRGPWRPAAGAARGHRRRGGHDPRRPPRRALPEQAHPAAGVAASSVAPSTIRAAWPSSPIRCALPAVRVGTEPARTPRRRRRAVHPDAIEAFNPTTAGALDASRPGVRRGGTGWPPSAAATPTGPADVGQASTTFRGTTAADLRRAIEARDTSWEGEFYTWRAQLGMFGRQLRKYARAVRDDVRGRLRRDGTGRDLGYPGGRRRPARFESGTAAEQRDEDRPRHAVHLPAAGRRQRARPLPLREPRRARPRRAHHQQHPRPATHQRGRHHPPRATASACPPTARSARSPSRLATAAGRARCSNASGSTCSTSTSRSCRSCRSQLLRDSPQRQRRHVPRLRRLEPGLRVRQAAAWRRFARRLHGRIAVSAAARHFIDRYFPGDYKVIPNGVDLHRYRRRASPSRAGATARRTSCSSAASRAARARCTCSRPTARCASAGLDCRLLLVAARAPGARGRAATSPRAGCSGVELLGRVSDDDKARYFATADVFVSPATGQEIVRHRAARGDGRGHAHRVQRHPRLQGRRPPRRAGAARAARATSRPWPRPSPRCSATPRCARGWAPAGRERAPQFGWENITAKVDDYYGFVIRRLAAQGALPADFRAEVPSASRPARAVDQGLIQSVGDQAP